MPEIIKRGTNSTFPVEHTNQLAKVQSVRVPTEEDIASNPIYSRILDERLTQALSTYPVAERTPQLQATVRANILAGIVGNIGSIVGYALQDITVAAGQTLTFQSSWSEVQAGDVRIASGGVIRVSVANPALPAFFLLKCNSIGSN
jgi:hypothetical protein